MEEFAQELALVSAVGEEVVLKDDLLNDEGCGTL